jgi:hypothetical protein
VKGQKAYAVGRPLRADVRSFRFMRIRRRFSCAQTTPPIAGDQGNDTDMVADLLLPL